MAILPHKEKKRQIKIFSFNKRTREYLEDLQSYYSLKRVDVASTILEKLFADKQIQKDFLEYSKSFVEIKGEDITKSDLHDHFTFSDELLPVFEKRIFDFKFNDRSKFLRALISFFHDKHFEPASKFTDFMDRISVKIMEEGCKIDKSVIIEGKMLFYVSIIE